VSLAAIDGYVCEHCGEPVYDGDPEGQPVVVCDEHGEVRGRALLLPNYRDGDGSIDWHRWAIDHGELDAEL
jgi:lysylphosphatidylglycerol synthetase-like protein (DUF2156 family)